MPHMCSGQDRAKKSKRPSVGTASVAQLANVPPESPIIPAAASPALGGEVGATGGGVGRGLRQGRRSGPPLKQQRCRRSSSKLITGVVYKVNACDKIRPPMMVMPSGRRSSEPGPVAMKVRFAPKPDVQNYRDLRDLKS